MSTSDEEFTAQEVRDAVDWMMREFRRTSHPGQREGERCAEVLGEDLFCRLWGLIVSSAERNRQPRSVPTGGYSLPSDPDAREKFIRIMLKDQELRGMPPAG